MKKTNKQVFYGSLALAILFLGNRCNWSSEEDNYSFQRNYNDSLSFHIVGRVYDIGLSDDIIYDRSFTLINKGRRDSLLINLSASERLSVYIKLDTIDFDGSSHQVMYIKNYANPNGKIVDLNKMEILANSISDSVIFDSTHLFLDKYSVTMKRDVK